jgi:ABC-2 type transport system permease protein
MLKEIFLFELTYRLKRPVTWVYTGILFSLAFALMALMGADLESVSVEMGGSGGIVFINSPFVINMIISQLTLLCIFITAAIMHNPIYKDFQYKTHELFFTKPVSRFQYIAGRFCGAFVVCIMVFTAAGIGVAIATFMPWMNKEMLGPFMPAAYVQTYAYLVIPNLLITGTIFFAIASYTRNSMAAQITAVLFFVGYVIAGSLQAEIENKFISSMVDPFGMRASQYVTEYWSASEKNALSVPLTGFFLYNRLLWLGLTLLFLGVFLKTFSFKAQAPSFNFLNKNKSQVSESAPGKAVYSPAQRSFTPIGYLRIMFSQIKLEYFSSVKSIPFLIIVAFGILLLYISLSLSGSMFGTNTHPVTYMMLSSLSSQKLILGIITIFYAGEFIWNERKHKIDQLVDVTPIPDWLLFASKFFTIALLQITILTVSIICGIAKQISEGYYHFEIGLYITEIFGLWMIDYLLLIVFVMFLQVMVNNKFLGYFVSALLLVLFTFFSQLGLEHPMWEFRSDLGYTYSDMNGYGHFLGPFAWYKIYWSGFALLLLFLALIFIVRGKDNWFKSRMKLAYRKASNPPFYSFAAGALLVFAASGSWVFYNQNVLIEYVPGVEQTRRVVNYENQYRKYKEMLHPRITSVKVELDIFPEERSYNAKGKYLLENKNDFPVDSFIVNASDLNKKTFIAMSKEAEIVLEDKDMDMVMYRFKEPLKPGETFEMAFLIKKVSKGFAGGSSVVYNGTFLNNSIFPSLGYQEGAELKDKDTRRKFGLADNERMPSINDEKARMNNYISSDADWVDFEATVSTSADQIAIAPGYLQKEWSEAGRRYFHFKMDSKILNFYSFNSARYEVLKDRWNNVSIEIFYHEGHEYNLDRMVKSIKSSLDYFTKNFSPYQHKQVRIIEFPRYSSFAQSFPNTIPYSESIGFIAKPKNEDDIDYVFYVTAHELAHQWWAHQIIGGNVQGSTMLSESMSQYGALMVMEKEYGKPYMRKFLEYESDEYLKSRSFERKKELPLMLNENQQYIHYNKGSIIFYAVREYLGEEKFNSFLQEFIRQKGFQQPPYTTSKEFVSLLREYTPDSLQYLITDMFEKIVLFDNNVVSAQYKKLPDGKFETTIKLEMKKTEADSTGKETEVRINDYVEIGIYDSEIKTAKPLGKEFYRKMHFINKKDQVIKIITAEKPVAVSLDPYMLLIDKKPVDNSILVEEAEKKPI